MCRVMTKHGSDKGRTIHNYTTVYSALLGNLSGPLKILEIGLGSNNPQFLFNMGPDGRPGASLRGWRELFPEAQVYGADIDRNILFSEHRIKTFYCDQLDAASIRELWSQPELQGGADIVLDDGLHTFEGNTSLLDESLEHVRQNGFYIVEDIRTDALERWRERIAHIYLNRFPTFEFNLVELPNSMNTDDNNILVVRRTA